MSNHVHLLVTEPEQAKLSTALQVLKQRFSRTRSEEFVWEPRYHDFNVFTEAKKIEKLRYMHCNPVKAGLVEQPDQWEWSSFRVYAHNEDHPSRSQPNNQNRIAATTGWSHPYRSPTSHSG